MRMRIPANALTRSGYQRVAKIGIRGDERIRIFAQTRESFRSSLLHRRFRRLLPNTGEGIDRNDAKATPLPHEAGEAHRRAMIIEIQPPITPFEP